ncbi:zinc finger Ran-binding domain-containing protein 2-like [Uloborus diversus]|uniref:zinc finger Ran-binding domain-containing protein 2-like n=1 Tax=Uloborus diversus TaxID=327109 RepID=UPI00240A3F0D|nr:zinc finger Ran-binding domain-containing protein 2-like [Uloborus diversus]
MNDGDWICSDTQCSNINFARRTTCNRCSKEKTAIPQRKKLGHEIGKAAAEKSRGLFSADDWQCGRCGNVNWARRQQCNMCNAPKFGEVEERTGLGGGYNERENVEYIERDESDGEYDEFGRKKKKYRGNDEKPIKSVPIIKEEKPKVLPSVGDEEDDEEDDDEDGDLSKYDLTGWGDDDDEENSTKKNKQSPSRSHSSASSRTESSRSRSRSSSSSSRSSKSSHSSSESEKSKSKNKRHYSRSRSGSPVNRKRSKKESSSSRSSTPSSKSRSRDRSASSSPVSRKK